MRLRLLSLVGLVGCISSLSVLASQIGTVTEVQGDVKIFSHPSASTQGPAPRAFFQDRYYTVQEAKVGSKVEKGNIVRTAPGSKARVTFDNGDQIHVGSGTAYEIDWKSPKTGTRLDMMYGKLRAVISKKSPRNRMSIRTRSATLGVRGTDLFVADHGPRGGTEVAVLLGEVQVQANGPRGASAIVKRGQSAEVPHERLEVTQKNVVEVRPISKPQLVVIQETSDIVKTDEGEAQVKKLRDKAKEVALADIQIHEKSLYHSIDQRDAKTTPELNTLVVRSLFKNAPEKAPQRTNTYKSTLEPLTEDAYERYFDSLSSD